MADLHCKKTYIVSHLHYKSLTTGCTVHIVFEVMSNPVPQGSMTASYNKKLGVSHVHHVQGSALALWRASIRLAADEAGARKVVGPIEMRIEFGMQRPKSHQILRGGKYVVKMQNMYDRPTSAPDIDKLLRAVMDALTKVCYYDDSQVVALIVEKKYGDTTKIEVTDEINDKHPQLSFGLGKETITSS